MDGSDLRNLLYTAQFTAQPFSIRYPKGNSDIEAMYDEFEKIEIGKAVELRKGSLLRQNTATAILTFGTIGQRIQNILNEINSNEKYAELGQNISHYKFIFCKPLDFDLLDEIFAEYKTIITFEEGILNGGFGDAILEYAQEKNFKGKIIRKGYPDKFIGHASVEELEKEIGLDEGSILEFLVEII